MRLNDKNYDEIILKIDSNKITDEMDTRIAVMTNSCKDSMAVKLYSILKREYAILLAVEENINGLQFPEIDYGDEEYLESFLTLYRIKRVIITSELTISFLLKYSTQEFEDKVSKLLKICRKNSIKLVYISIETPFHLQEGNKYAFYGMSSKKAYNEANGKIIRLLSGDKNSLIIESSTVYGANDYLDIEDFPEFVFEMANRGIAQEYDNQKMLYPIMMDEAAIYISEHIDETGYVNLLDSNHIKGVTAYQWANQILEIRGRKELKKNVIASLEQPLGIKCLGDTIREYGDFSDTKTGYYKELRQKSCIFQLIYKLSPMEYFNGESVAKVRVELGKALSTSFPKRLLEKADYVVPVPKTGLYYAMGLAAGIGIPYVQALSKGGSELRSFQVNNVDVRKCIIRDKVQPIPELIEGKKLIVVDEAIFTGTTLKVVCKILRECGAKEIYLGIPTPECYNQCTNYVQPKRPMLLEYIRRNMLEDYFEVESVIFQNSEMFKQKMSVFNGACMECFGGRE